MRVGRKAKRHHARGDQRALSIPGPEELLLRALYIGHVSNKVDVRALAEHLRQVDAPIKEKMLFEPTSRGWRPRKVA